MMKKEVITSFYLFICSFNCCFLCSFFFFVFKTQSDDLSAKTRSLRNEMNNVAKKCTLWSMITGMSQISPHSLI